MAVEQHAADNNNRGSAEQRAYMDELWRRLRVFSRRSASIPAQAQGSLEWLAAVGAFWQRAREDAGLTREDVAGQLGLSVDQVRLREFGLMTPPELSERRLRSYARALGDADLYHEFRQRFDG